jgi:hypothetical protein
VEIGGKRFSKVLGFFFFCILLNENNTKSHDFNTVRKLREGTTTLVSWEIDTERLQENTGRLKKSHIDYKSW